MPRVSRRYWFTFENDKVNSPCIWMMSRKYPEVSFDIRQASVKTDIGIMAVLLQGEDREVEAAVQYLRELGVGVEPVEKNVVES